MHPAQLAQEKKADSIAQAATMPLAERLAHFENRVALAVIEGDDSIETDPDLMDVILRKKPWKDVGYFCYKGIKVYAHGTKDAIEADESIQSDQRLHGDKAVLQKAK